MDLDGTLEKEKFTWSRSERGPRALHFILQGQTSGKVVGEIEAIVQKRKMINESKPLYGNDLEPPGETYLREAEEVKAKFGNSSYLDAASAPIHTIAYVSMFGIEDVARSPHIERALLRQLLPALEEVKAEYLVGKYVGWGAQERYGMEESTPGLFQRLVDEWGGNKLDDGTYWIPVSPMRHYTAPLAARKQTGDNSK